MFELHAYEAFLILVTAGSIEGLSNVRSCLLVEALKAVASQNDNGVRMISDSNESRVIRKNESSSSIRALGFCKALNPSHVKVHVLLAPRNFSCR